MREFQFSPSTELLEVRDITDCSDYFINLYTLHIEQVTACYYMLLFMLL